MCVFKRDCSSLGMNKKIVGYVLLVAWLASCDHKKGESVENVTCTDSATESLWIATDSLILSPDTMPEKELPKTVDELFDDFIFEFAQNKKVQSTRVRYPLPVIMHGDTTWLKQKEWRHEALFLNQDYYTVLFNKARQMDLEKDTSLEHVDVEWMLLNKRLFKTYHFERHGGRWQLTQESVQSFQDSPLEDFLNFYTQFVSDSVYQMQCVVEPLRFITTDPDDDFQVIEGTLDSEQWMAFRPLLPEETLTNIRYGQTYHDPNQMVLVKKGIANGLMDMLTFEKKSGKWKLVAFEN